MIYPPSVEEEDAEIVLKRSQLKKTIYLAVGNAMTLIDEHIISALQMSNDEKHPSPMRAAVSASITTIICKHVNQAAVADMVTKATSQAVKSPDVIPTLADALVTNDGSMKHIARFVMRTV